MDGRLIPDGGLRAWGHLIFILQARPASCGRARASRSIPGPSSAIEAPRHAGSAGRLIAPSEPFNFLDGGAVLAAYAPEHRRLAAAWRVAELVLLSCGVVGCCWTFDVLREWVDFNFNMRKSIDCGIVREL